jgi:pyrophosphatase PpaX
MFELSSTFSGLAATIDLQPWRQRMIKGVLFDLDGTVINTKPFIVASYEHVCTTHGLTVITEQMIQALGGASLHDTYRHYCPDQDVHKLVAAHCEWQDQHKDRIATFPDSAQTLVRLAGLGLVRGIITSRHKNASVLLLTTGIFYHFSVIVTADDVKNSKPDPEGMLLALDQLGLNRDEVVFVGDMAADIQLGRNTGVMTIGVACGFSTAEEMASFQPDHICDSLEGILPIIESLIS